MVNDRVVTKYGHGKIVSITFTKFNLDSQGIPTYVVVIDHNGNRVTMSRQDIIGYAPDEKLVKQGVKGAKYAIGDKIILNNAVVVEVIDSLIVGDRVRYNVQTVPVESFDIFDSEINGLF